MKKVSGFLPEGNVISLPVYVEMGLNYNEHTI